jgi:hypothetical protein
LAHDQQGDAKPPEEVRSRRTSELSDTGRVEEIVRARAALAIAVAALALAALAGCAGSASQRTVNDQDFGRTVSVHVGDTVKVDLLDRFPFPGSSIVWRADTTDPATLRRVSAVRETPTGIMNGQARYTAIFKAVARGTAIIQATGAATCEAMNPAFCPQHSGTIAVTVD